MPNFTEDRTSSANTLERRTINEFYDVSVRKKITFWGKPTYITHFKWKQDSGDIKEVIITGNQELIDLTVIFKTEISDNFKTGLQTINVPKAKYKEERYEFDCLSPKCIKILDIVVDSDDYKLFCDLLFPNWYSRLHNSPRLQSDGTRLPRNSIFFTTEHLATIAQYSNFNKPVIFSFRSLLSCLPVHNSHKSFNPQSNGSESAPNTPASHPGKIAIRLE